MSISTTTNSNAKEKSSISMRTNKQVSATSRRHKLISFVNFTSILLNLSSQMIEATTLIRNNDENHHQVAPNEQQKLMNDSTTSSTDHLKLVNNLDINALIYLQKYGYMNANLNTEANNLISENSFSDAITSFQKFAGIPVTGIVDELTSHYMQLPRCGNTDKTNDNKLTTKVITKTGSLRKKRYALQGSKWRRQELTYRISQYPTRFNGKRHEVDAQIEKAFSIWSQVAPINFIIKRDGRVHIDIRFASGDHGDGDAFDGPGNTLAHAYFPQYGGDAHFDDQEYWTIDSYAGTNIFQVAAHELGHSLGLGHSNVREALMAPFYQKYKPDFKLHVDDVLAIQALYGEKPLFLANDHVPQSSLTPPQTTTTTTTTTTTSTTPPPSTTTTTQKSFISSTYGSRIKPNFFNTNDNNDNNPIDNSLVPEFSSSRDDSTNYDSTSQQQPSPANNLPADLCLDPTIDAITRTEDGNSYVFKNDYYWLLTSDGLAKGYPRRISNDWDGLPGKLDAALTWADGKTFFFKENKYWRFKNRRRDVGYPKLISAGFSGIPNNIDAAFVWSGNGRTYIFKGAEYWRFDSKADPPVSAEYPRSIRVWNGIPSHINAAFKWENNVTYFFKGNQYYRFNDKEFKVESRGRPPFPRLSSEWWFGCVNSNSLAAQKALSSSLVIRRENLGSTNLINQQQQQTTTTVASSSNNINKQEDIDWSFYSGFNDKVANSTTLGTHINDINNTIPNRNDYKPSIHDNNNKNYHDDDFIDDFYQRRIGIQHHFIPKDLTSFSPSSSSSSVTLSFSLFGSGNQLLSILTSTLALHIMIIYRRPA